MTLTEEGDFTTSDGAKLYTKAWKPDSGSISAVLIFVHGFSDHINAYYDLFPTLSSPPYKIAIYGFDQRGWGRSVSKPSDNGLTGPTSRVLSDIHDFVIHVASIKENHGQPLFLMGHSMGGGEALCYMLSTSQQFSNRPPISGLLLEAPYIELDPVEQPNPLTVIGGRLAALVMPNMQMKQELHPTYMSRSAKVRQEWVDDPLNHDTGTLEGLKGLLERAGDLSKLSHGHKVPGLTAKMPCAIWLAHGTGDRVLSPQASRRFFEALEAPYGDKEFKSYPDGYHKLHAEPDGMGEQFAKDVGEWVLGHAKEAPKQASQVT
ncbi:hypothetical protein LTR10_021510 [Elasticomyces elasticus]|uniref:Serine aminopeptidase S33 domain-containing protein n=1 Tax=Exophiala sideris TaxID=1016849 RepID=A0ABR0J9J4_9EURO|nr:hypothetical protein LTR10_021510 [Elasticomyces elasticus]KAK5027966.1 hypothetical protein LTS07_006842 [Exophiala sideris]KAK5037443.1 hypothetical protein LTR13_004600 [Exophiala sideris]KAK5059105.1 hypothetical protein LTR69_006394 [Exophiala sideris]KAK5182938.1 hypothetical protein LTR44_004648 [Eurotiomycetes sp. CCFEE 6388]